MTKRRDSAPEAETRAIVAAPPSAIATLASRLGVESTGMFLQSLKSVAFKAPNVTNEQLMALVVVANQYKLNPFTRELYAFPDKGGGIVPIVSIDGWLRIINEQPTFDGMEYAEGKDDDGLYGECTMYRSDRSRPSVIREYLKEVQRNTDPWKQHTHRMLRHKTIVQAARVAFGFAGIYDPDEGERILQAQRVVNVTASQSAIDRMREVLDSRPDKVVEDEAGDRVPQVNEDAAKDAALDSVELDEDGRVGAVTIGGNREADDDLPI
jgi:phage recombination protein Bet